MLLVTFYLLLFNSQIDNHKMKEEQLNIFVRSNFQSTNLPNKELILYLTDRYIIAQIRYKVKYYEPLRTQNARFFVYSCVSRSSN